jgi:hypothetical protein
MTPDPPATPQGEPTNKEPAAPPPVAAGSVWRSAADWYERNKNHKSIFSGDYYKKTVGISVSAVYSATTKITLGWEHKTVVGLVRQYIGPYENKVNVGFVLNFIRSMKSETTAGNKTEWILGVKIGHVRGEKTKYQGGEKTLVSVIEKAQKTKKLSEHVTAMEKIMATAIEQEIKDLEEEHATLEGSYGKYEQLYDEIERKIDTWTQKAGAFQGKFESYREECENVAEKYSGTFKSVAAAAHEINASASVEKTLNAEAKFIAGSLIELGAAITKAG